MTYLSRTGGLATMVLEAVHGPTAVYSYDYGCRIALRLDGFSPRLFADRCVDDFTPREAERRGSLFPLAVGTSETWVLPGRADRPATTWRCLTVDKVDYEGPLGVHPAHVIECTHESHVRTYVFSDKIGLPIVSARRPIGGDDPGQDYYFELCNFSLLNAPVPLPPPSNVPAKCAVAPDVAAL
ncbi:MAG: hypothetical protein AAF439_02050 [Pseudomonadota bacterium]